jgi:hypothetical protein
MCMLLSCLDLDVVEGVHDVGLCSSFEEKVKSVLKGKNSSHNVKFAYDGIRCTSVFGKVVFS